VDERALDDGFALLGPEGHALDLARRKARSVSPRHPGRVVVAADQVGVLDTGDGPVLLTKQPTTEGAVAQLRSMSATTHRLVNGLVVVGPDGVAHEGVDVELVTMRAFGEEEALAYVRRFEPFDTAGSYRLEDQEQLPPGEGLVVSVAGEDRSGVLGLPLPLLRRLLALVSPPPGPA
jgi:septum formation protein